MNRPVKVHRYAQIIRVTYINWEKNNSRIQNKASHTGRTGTAKGPEVAQGL